MEERIYRGEIDPRGLAQHLVGMFSQGGDLVAQQVEQGDQLLVQISRVSTWSGKLRGAISVSIKSDANSMRVTVGNSKWLDLTDPLIGGSLLGAIFFPALIVLPLMRGMRSYALTHDLWNEIDNYCTHIGINRESLAPARSQAGVATKSRDVTVEQEEVYCPHCGAHNRMGARHCYLCGTALTQDGQPPRQPAVKPDAQGEVICPRCEATVHAGKFCSSCGSALSLVTP